MNTRLRPGDKGKVAYVPKSHCMSYSGIYRRLSSIERAVGEQGDKSSTAARLPHSVDGTVAKVDLHQPAISPAREDGRVAQYALYSARTGGALSASSRWYISVSSSISEARRYRSVLHCDYKRAARPTYPGTLTATGTCTTSRVRPLEGIRIRAKGHQASPQPCPRGVAACVFPGCPETYEINLRMVRKAYLRRDLEGPEKPLEAISPLARTVSGPPLVIIACEKRLRH